MTHKIVQEISWHNENLLTKFVRRLQLQMKCVYAKNGKRIA